MKRINLDLFVGFRELLRLRLRHLKSMTGTLAGNPKKMISFIFAITVVCGGAIYAFSPWDSKVKADASALKASHVVLNGQTVGIVENIQDGQNLVATILRDRGVAIGVSAKTHDRLEFTEVQVNKDEVQFLSKDELQQNLTSYFEGIEILIEGQTFCILPTKEDADKLLKAYQGRYIESGKNNEITSLAFEENVEIRVQETSADQLTSYDKAYESLLAGSVQRTSYTLQPNDSWWLLARKHNLMIDDIIAANPGYKMNSVLIAGEEIVIEKVKPYLSVISKGTVMDKEAMPFDVVTTIDPNLPNGEVTREGIDGEKEVIYTYEKRNDMVIAKNVREERITLEPVSQIVANRNAKIQPERTISRGNGQISLGLARPIRGIINSPFGSRAGGFHTGVDFEGSTGDPFSASGSGSVVSAEFAGGYGNSIIINHGNGIVTRYAHASKLLVQAGQNVVKGQTIGLVGSSGRSTGAHLHFEVILNGNALNPMDFITD